MMLGDYPPWFLGLALFALGTCVGSFLNVCIYRLPQHEPIGKAWGSLLDPPSSCPYCRKRIWFIDNIPIFGWLMLRGRCRFCQRRISVRYPLVEALNGALWVGLYFALVPSGFSAHIQQSCVYSVLGPFELTDRQLLSFWLHVRYAYYLVLVEALVVASFIDLDLMVIPDSVTLPALGIGLLGSLTGMVHLLPIWFQDPFLLGSIWSSVSASPSPWWLNVRVPGWIAAAPVLHGLAASLAGAIIGSGLVWFIRIAGGRVFRREAMGFGDVVLMAMIGSFLGWQPMFLVTFLAPVFALVVIAGPMLQRGLAQLLTQLGSPTSWGQAGMREIPFGPYLSLAAILVIFLWKPLFDATEQYFALGPFFPPLVVGMSLVFVGLLWLVQGLKRLLGIPLYEADWMEDWTSADQLGFFASKDRQLGSGSLQRSEWPGTAAGQGTLHRDRWTGRGSIR